MKKEKRIAVKDTPFYDGKEVVVCGWVGGRRDHGKIIFIDLRDRSGFVQVVLTPGVAGSSGLRLEYVVRVTGTVAKRPMNMVNPSEPNGAYEIQASELKILNPAAEIPIPLDVNGYDINEEARMRYRYLDLRRARLAKNLAMRHKVIKFIRDFLDKKEFLEIETPILTKSTPEGARDYLVPSRIEKGKFYALPQSPQQYKQLLMVAGVEKYFQIARCFRDEDTRGQRQPEFTQLDLEMSFVNQEDIMQITEELFTSLVENLYPEKKITEKPWPRISFKETMDRYKTDSPDLRKNKDDRNELAFAWVLDFPLFTEQKTDDFFHGSGRAKFAPSHHMFTAPHTDDIALLETDPMKVRGLQHDIVLNGLEVGGGSIRIHNSEIQKKIFDLIGFTEEQKEHFSRFLEAFTYGAPPHGGIAPGIDRLVMILQNEPNIREVIAFPKSGDGHDFMMDAPSEVEKKQLDELGIKVINE